MFSRSVNTPLIGAVYAWFMSAPAKVVTPLDRLLAEAQRRHWKDADLCRRLGISQQRLNNWKERGLALAGAVTAAQKLNLSLDYIVFGKTPGAGDVRAAGEPLALYTTTPDRQKRMLDLFDQLTPLQQDQILSELQAHVDANLAVVKHFSGRKMRHTPNERIEATFGLPTTNTRSGS